MPIELPYVHPLGGGLWVAKCPTHLWVSEPQESESDALDRLSVHLVLIHGKKAA
jgi:hypothetical protein